VARGSRARARRIGAGLACLLLIGGCYYVRYASLVRTHVDLMIALAAKRHDLHVAEAPPSHLAEFRYPLERARDFARIVGPRFGERESFRLSRRVRGDARGGRVRGDRIRARRSSRAPDGDLGGARSRMNRRLTPTAA
jgi:hypothetical protein